MFVRDGPSGLCDHLHREWVAQLDSSWSGSIVDAAMREAEEQCKAQWPRPAVPPGCDLPDHHIRSLVMYGPASGVEAFTSLVQAKVRAAGKDVMVVTSSRSLEPDSWWVDFVSTRAGKGHATLWVRGLLGFGPRNTMVAGDSGNDIAMLETDCGGCPGGGTRGWGRGWAMQRRRLQGTQCLGHPP